MRILSFASDYMEGAHPALMRRLGKGRLVTADTDASGSRAMFYDRVKLLTDIDD